MSGRRRWTRVLLALTSLLAVAAAPSSPAPGNPEGPSYGVRPAHHDDSEAAGRSFTHAVEAGTPVIDGVEIFNFTDEPAVFDVYPADMVDAGGGAQAPAARDATIVAAGAWVVPARDRIEVGPERSLVVPLTIEVPVGTEPGSYRAALLVEPVRSGTESTIEARTRVALPVELEVLGAIDLGIELGRLGWSRDDGGIRFELPVTNGGNVTFVAGAEVLIDRGGDRPPVRIGMEPADRTLAPGAVTTLSTLWGEAPWFGRVTARPVVVARVGERTPIEHVGDEVTFWVVPWTQLLAALLVAVAIVIVLLMTRDRRRRWRERRREERALLRAFRAQRGSPLPPVEQDRTDELPIG
jgi:hypothetical protein